MVEKRSFFASRVSSSVSSRMIAVLFMASLVVISAGCASKQPVAGNGSYLHVRAEEARAEGIEAYRLGDLSSALQNFDSALKIDRAVDDKESEVIDLINIARVSIALEDLPGAGAYLDTAIKTSIEADSTSSLGAAYATLAKVEYLTGRHDSALSYIEESIQVDRKHGIKSGAALNLMGSILAEAGKTKEAHSVLKRALKLNSANSNSLEQANSYRSLGHLHSIMKEHDKAVKQYRLAYDLDKKAGHSEKIAVDLSSLAALHSKSGHLLKAVYLLERSYIVNLNSGRHLEAIANLTRLIRTYDKLGNTDKVHYFARIKSSLIKSYEDGRIVNGMERN